MGVEVCENWFMKTKPKVLLIDDEADILEVVGLILETEGFEVTKSISGAEALVKLETEHFDIVVSDYLMPKMDGIQLLKKVREQKDFTPFIFFSGNADESDELKMTGLGAYEMLPKSQLADLSETIHRFLKLDAGLKLMDAPTEESDEFLKLIHAA